MAVVALVMAGDEGTPPTFHDFFAVTRPEGAACPPPARFPEAAAPSSFAYGAVPAGGELGSERQVGNSLGFQLHSLKCDFPGGKKRSNSDSHFMGLTRDQLFQVGADGPENQQLMKTFPSKDGSEPSRCKHGDVMMAGGQGPRPVSTAYIYQPTSFRHEIAMPNADWSSPVNVGYGAHHRSPFSPLSPYESEHSPGRQKDAISVTLISQRAADEGSRTGIKGSTILNIVNSSSANFARHSSEVQPPTEKLMSCTNSAQTGYNILPRVTCVRRQMTIFYAGQAHVFDDVHPDKADAVMALAGSNGGSWSTSYSLNTNIRPSITDPHLHAADNERFCNTNVGAFVQQIYGKPSAGASSNPGLSQGASDGGPSESNTGDGVQEKELNTEGPALNPKLSGSFKCIKPSSQRPFLFKLGAYSEIGKRSGEHTPLKGGEPLQILRRTPIYCGLYLTNMRVPETRCVPVQAGGRLRSLVFDAFWVGECEDRLRHMLKYKRCVIISGEGSLELIADLEFLYSFCFSGCRDPLGMDSHSESITKPPFITSFIVKPRKRTFLSALSTTV